MVYKSEIIWVGCSKSDKAFTTGILELSSNLINFVCEFVLKIKASIYNENILAVSAIDSPLDN